MAPSKHLDDARKTIANEMGFPVLVKAAAGGGGRGMKVAREADELESALATARAEAKAAFGDDSVYIEKFLLKSPAISRSRCLATVVVARFISANATVHCSGAIRKVLEEAQSPALNDEARSNIGATVAAAMQDMSYRGAGTVEFLYENGAFYLHRNEYAPAGRASLSPK